jgi:lipid-A-disaccharide synthase
MAGTGLKTFMLIAGETSGDLLASELVLALREKLPDAKFFGAGGPKMAAAGMELAVDMTQHAVVGIPTIGKILALKRVAGELLDLAIKRKPDAVIGVDYGGFNLRFGHSVKEYARNHTGDGWNPKLVQFVSPQVWASRPRRAKQLAADYDLLLSIFPFEKEWYAKRAPNLRVEFVGHPMVERMPKAESRKQKTETGPMVLLLPGSRKSELRNHLPVMLEALKYIQGQMPTVRAKMVLPDEHMRGLAAAAEQAKVEIQVGNLPEALAQADLAITKTGTVTMECAFFGVPAVTIYKKSLLGLALELGVITVTSLTMPNLMAGETVYPEFLAGAATPENVAIAALRLLRDASRRQKIKAQLSQIVSSLGEPGASRRAAAAIINLFP